MTILILHGIMGYADENWMQWLHDELVKEGHTVIMPDLPEPNHPDRQTWLEEIVKSLANIQDDIVIVGHSIGVTSALDFCQRDGANIRALVCVSGLSDAYGLELNDYFLNANKIDFEMVKKHVGSFYIIYGDNDPYVPQEILSKLSRDLDTKPHIVAGGGHLNKTAGFVTLPQVLEFILSLNTK